MTSDCYCAICGSCIGNFEVGSKSGKGQRVRSKVLRNRRRRGSEPQESISEPDDDSYNNRDEESHTLSGQYDPQVLEGHDTSWITELLLVANDPRKRRPPRTFICGTARDTGFGWGTCSGTQDAWKYGVEDYECDRLPLWSWDESYNGESAGLGNYPCHVPCLKMLARAIVGTEDFHQINVYPLHRAMARLYRDQGRALDVDYGIELDQYWQSRPGEEFYVINPLEQFPITGSLVCDFIATEERKSVEQSLASKVTHVQHDPFCKLPVELIHHVASYMDGHELIALRQVSRFVRQATRSSSFWKRLLLREQAWLWDTPFSVAFWEPSREAGSTQHMVDWEKLYIVMENSTASGFGTRGAMMALANRRRIWKVCGEIARVYWKKWPRREEFWEADRYAERAPIPEEISGAYDDDSPSDSDSDSDEEEEEEEEEDEGTAGGR